mgnify:CR=1 FL=1
MRQQWDSFEGVGSWGWMFLQLGYRSSASSPMGKMWWRMRGLGTSLLPQPGRAALNCKRSKSMGQATGERRGASSHLDGLLKHYRRAA